MADKEFDWLVNNKPFIQLFLYFAKFIPSTRSILTNVEPANSGTMTDVKEKLVKLLGAEYVDPAKRASRDHLLEYTPKREELTPRFVKDSYVMASIPLRTDKLMQERYVSNVGTVRYGRLMEDMDLFSVWVCQQHVKLSKLPPDGQLPYIFVTVVANSMKIRYDIHGIDNDLRVSGYVSWVGNSSFEVLVWVHVVNGNELHEITQAGFLMAGRNANNSGPAPVNHLQPHNDEEKEILAKAELRRQQNAELRKASVWQEKPTQEEHDLMYDLLEKTTDKTSLELYKRILPPNSRWMSEAYAVTTILSFPENKNRHNTVFGGFLMRIAFEISLITSFKHCKSYPKLEHVSEFTFQKSVPVQSLLRILAHIIYVEKNYMMIMTTNDVLDPTTSQKITSNVSYFVMSAPNDVQPVIPRSYQETLLYIHGRRKFKNLAFINEKSTKTDIGNDNKCK
uniref:HotDog ACOT-type domain-containing protein n=1 Tax=Glossina brevipalpis TaxID=37001 RepID=A0A1A9WRN6_9MUSC